MKRENKFEDEKENDYFFKTIIHTPYLLDGLKRLGKQREQVPPTPHYNILRHNQFSEINKPQKREQIQKGEGMQAERTSSSWPARKTFSLLKIDVSKSSDVMAAPHGSDRAAASGAQAAYETGKETLPGARGWSDPHPPTTWRPGDGGDRGRGERCFAKKPLGLHIFKRSPSSRCFLSSSRGISGFSKGLNLK